MKALFFLQPGGNSRRIFLDLISGAGEAGWECAVLDLSPYFARSMTQETAREFTKDVERAVLATRPDVTCSMWSNVLSMLMHTCAPDGTVTTLFDRLGVTHICHWLDAPHWAQDRTLVNMLPNPVYRSPGTLHIVNNAATAHEMERLLGFGPTAAVPYGVRAHSHQRSPRGGARAFFDAVVSLGPGDPRPGAIALEQLKNDDPDMLAVRWEAAQRVRAKLIKQHAACGCLQRACGPREWEACVDTLIQGQIENGYDAPMLTRLEGLLHSVHAAAVKAIMSHPGCYITITGLVRAIESSLRAFTVTWLSMRCNIGLFGGGSLVESGWPCCATELGDVPYESMAACYALGNVSLNIMRWQDDVGLNLKPFEITAAGGVLLNARRPGFVECFEEDVQAMQFSSPAECEHKLRYLLDNDTQREAIAQRGYERTMATHTWEHRIPAFEALMKRAAVMPAPARLQQAV